MFYNLGSSSTGLRLEKPADEDQHCLLITSLLQINWLIIE